MNKVLVTGLGIGNSMEICQSCNMDYSWLINNPATFIWADKICIPANLFGQYPDNKNKYSNAIKHVMDIIDDAGMVEKIVIPDSYKKEARTIYAAAIADAEQIVRRFPEVVKKGDVEVPDEIIINGTGFCGPYIASIYASIELADRIGANCLFDKKANSFLAYRYGLDVNSRIHENEHRIYNEVFQTLIPNEPILPGYIIEDEKQCKICMHYDKCSKNYIGEIEQRLSTILKWREYDEIYRAKEVVEDLIWRKGNLNSENDVKEVVKEFEGKKKKINEIINKRFPVIHRWTKLVTIIASPIALYSYIYGDTTLTAVSLGLAGLSTAVEKAAGIYKSHNNWVGFFDKQA